MPPMSNSFAYANQAWDPMATGPSYRRAVQQQEILNLEAHFGGRILPRRESVGGSTLDSLSREDVYYSGQHSAASTSSSSDDSPPHPLTRTKSSPSFASMGRSARRLPQTLRDKFSHEGKLPFNAHKVTKVRSRSFTRPKTSNRRMDRQTSTQSLSESSSSDSTRCQMHPQVRMRSNRCPLCAAGEKMRRRSSHKSFHEHEKHDDHFAAEGVNNSVEEMSQVVDDDVESTEEVSLDPKWADALRKISERLADMKQHQSTDDDSGIEEDGHLEDRVNRDAMQYMSTLNDLHQPIEQATTSFGSYSDEEEDDISRSSFAQDAPATKRFAESKGHQNNPYPQTRYYQEDYLSAGLAKLVGSQVTAVDHSSRSTGSDDSSVTLSVTSNYTYNSLVGPPLARSPFVPYAAKETQDSKGMTESALDSHQRIDEESEEEEETDLDFESSFLMAVPKDYSEKKMTKMEPSFSLQNEQMIFEDATDTHTYTHTDEKLEQNEHVVAEDVTDDHKDAEPEQMATPSKPRRSSTAQPSFISALANNSRSRSRGRKQRSASRSKSRDVHRSKSRGHNGHSRSKSRSRQAAVTSELARSSQSKSPNSSAAVEKRETTGLDNQGKPVMTEGVLEDEEETMPPSKAAASSEPGPSFFSALIHNSRNSRSASRSKSRGRQATGADKGVTLNDANITDDAISLAECGGKKVHDGEGHRADPQVVDYKGACQEYPQSDSPEKQSSSSGAHHPTLVDRGPITLHSYNLGDLVREGDMIVFPKMKSRHGRRRRRRRKNRRSDGSLSSESSESEDEEEEIQSRHDYIISSIGELRHLDAAAIKRSDGTWSYSLVADGDTEMKRFVVNAKGSTKTFPKSLWKSCVRRVRVLTPRKGDRFTDNKQPNRKRRSLARSRSFREKGRLVSPSPNRKMSNALRLPPTIFEDSLYISRDVKVDRR